jgi:hypothetical protein
MQQMVLQTDVKPTQSKIICSTNAATGLLQFGGDALAQDAALSEYFVHSLPKKSQYLIIVGESECNSFQCLSSAH